MIFCIGAGMEDKPAKKSSKRPLPVQMSSGSQSHSLIFLSTRQFAGILKLGRVTLSPWSATQISFP